MEYEFETEDMKKIFSNILYKLQEPDEISLFKTDLSVVEKPNEKSTEIESPIHTPIFPPSKPSIAKSEKKIKASEFNNTTLARMNLRTQKSIENLKAKKELLEKKEAETLKNKPDINPNSKKIGRRNEKVFERAEKELVDRRKKISEKKQKLDAEKEAKIVSELTFKPNIPSGSGNKRTIDEFFQYNLEWKNRSQRRLELKRAEIEEKMVAELRDYPEIDSNSANIVSQIHNNKPIEIRLIERLDVMKKKKEEKFKELDYPYKPVISRRSKEIVKKNKGKNVFNRLFSLSIEATPSPIKSPNFGEKRHKSFSFTKVFGEEDQKSVDITFNE